MNNDQIQESKESDENIVVDSALASSEDPKDWENHSDIEVVTVLLLIRSMIESKHAGIPATATGLIGTHFTSAISHSHQQGFGCHGNQKPGVVPCGPWLCFDTCV